MTQENKNITNNKNYLTKNAILLSRTIEDYRQEEINEQKKRRQNIEDCKFNGDESFLLNQIYKTGKTFDYAYLSGKKENKTFLGFQMKCYFNNNILDDKSCGRGDFWGINQYQTELCRTGVGVCCDHIHRNTSQLFIPQVTTIVLFWLEG